MQQILKVLLTIKQNGLLLTSGKRLKQQKPIIKRFKAEYTLKKGC